MPITTKRIINLDNAASVANDDYIVLDGTTNGTRKYATSGKGLSKNDYTDAEKSDVAKIDGIETDVSDLKNDIDDLNNGLQTFGFDYQFVHGYISQGNVTTGITYRFVSQQIMSYSRNLTISIANGFRAGYHLYNDNDSYKVNNGWQTGTLSIPANQKFRIEIARVTENTSENASYAEFVGAITFKSNIAVEFDAVREESNEIIKYNNGQGNLQLGNSFERGYIAGGNILPVGYRVVSSNILVYNYNVEITIANGFRVGIHKYNWNDTYLINDGWKTGTYLIPAYTKLRIEIARVTENTSESADITDFVSQISFTSAIAHELNSINDNGFIQSYAHKGYALTAPECTASAYIEAKRRGYSGAECDIQVTSDGKFVIWHDGTLSKLGYGNPISNYTLAQLQAFDFGSWKSSKYAGETILTFEDFVLLCKKLGLQILIDTKFEYSEAQITELSGIVNKYGMMDKAIWYINFNGSYLAKLKELYPKARVAWIGTATEARCQIVKNQLVDGVDYSVCLIPAIADLTAEDVERAHSYGISAGCYTSVDFDSLDISTLKTAMSNAIDMGIDLIVSDVYRAKDIADEELSV